MRLRLGVYLDFLPFVFKLVFVALIFEYQFDGSLVNFKIFSILLDIYLFVESFVVKTILQVVVELDGSAAATCYFSVWLEIS